MSMKDMSRKDTSKNGKGAMLGLIVIVCLALAGCGGGGAGSSASSTTTNTPEPTGNTSTGHPHGMWSMLPSTMPINPVHAALLHTGKVLIVSGSGNCPPQQAGCPETTISSGRGSSGPDHQYRCSDAHHLGHVL